MVRLPMLVAGPNGKVVTDPEDGMPDPFAAGTPRPAGVHLHWAMPDALLRGTLDQRADGAANRLALPLLPDRWVVLRLLLPTGGSGPGGHGLGARGRPRGRRAAGVVDRGRRGVAGRQPQGAPLAKGELTGTVGGAVSWSGIYDAVLNRFAFHDPLADVAALAPNGVDENSAAYLVAGWWSDAAHDPLDAARSNDSLHELLDRLRWRLLAEWGDEQWAAAAGEGAVRAAQGARADHGGALVEPRARATTVGRRARRAPATSAAPFVPSTRPSSSSRADRHRRRSPPRPARASSPRPGTCAPRCCTARSTACRSSGEPLVDRRPAAAALSVALGQHDDDLLAAFAAPPQARPPTSAAPPSGCWRRSPRRRSTASPRPTASSSSRSTSTPPPSRRCPAARPAPTATCSGCRPAAPAAHRVGKHRAKAGKTSAAAAERHGAERDSRPTAAPRAGRGRHASARRDDLRDQQQADADRSPPSCSINDVARSRVGDVLAPTEARVVDRPAARFTFPDEPMVAIRGAVAQPAPRRRRPRLGRRQAHLPLADARDQRDQRRDRQGPLHPLAGQRLGAVARCCRWRARRCSTIPYHDEWIAAAVAPSSAARPAIFQRLKAESVLRFGADGTYDGTTVAFHPTVARTAAARRAQAAAAQRSARARRPRARQTLVADELRKFSLYKGADPDLVGVTTWAQPWVPMWLEWEVTVEGLDPPTLDAWRLGAIDLERDRRQRSTATAAVLRGRALLTTGAAATLHDAITDWLQARGRARRRRAPASSTKRPREALRVLDEAVRHLDVVTAALDGVRTQLLGFPVDRRPAAPRDGGGVAQPGAGRGAARRCSPAPSRCTRARLLDAFGRTLEVPLASVATPTRATLPGRPGALALAPRLLRPARWQFRLVDAATAGRRRRRRGARRPDRAVAAGQPGGRLRDARPSRREPRGVRRRRRADRRAAARAGERRRDVGDRGRPRGPGRFRPALRADAGAAGARPLRGRARRAPTRAARAGAPLAVRRRARSRRCRRCCARSTPRCGRSTPSPRSAASTWPGWSAGRSRWCARSCGWSCSRPTTSTSPIPQRAAEWADAEREAARYAFPVRIGELTRSDDGVLGLLRRRRLLALPPGRQGHRRHRRRGGAQPRPARPVRQPAAARPREADRRTRTSPAPTTPTRCCCTSARP